MQGTRDDRQTPAAGGSIRGDGFVACGSSTSRLQGYLGAGIEYAGPIILTSLIDLGGSSSLSSSHIVRIFSSHYCSLAICLFPPH